MFYSSDDLIVVVICVVNRADIKDQYTKKNTNAHIDIVLFSLYISPYIITEYFFIISIKLKEKYRMKITILNILL